MHGGGPEDLVELLSSHGPGCSQQSGYGVLGIPGILHTVELDLNWNEGQLKINIALIYFMIKMNLFGDNNWFGFTLLPKLIRLYV